MPPEAFTNTTSSRGEEHPQNRASSSDILPDLIHLPSAGPSEPRIGHRQSVTLSILQSLRSGATSNTSIIDPNISFDPSALNSTTAAQRAGALRQLTTDSLRSRIIRHRPAKSTGSSTTASSQPVIVRTYSGPRYRNRVQSPPLVATTPMPHHATLPPIEEFSFDGILRAVDPEISSAIDAIAEICARSRLSLADEYSAHIPPQGDFLARTSRGFWGRYTGLDSPLTAVPEASSSSERLAGDSRAPSTSDGHSKTRSTAVGSLRSIMSGRKKKKKKQPQPPRDEVVPAYDSDHNTQYDGYTSHEGEPSSPTSARPNHRSPSWVVLDTSHPAIALVAGPMPSKQLSLDTSTPLVEAPVTGAPNQALPPDDLTDTSRSRPRTRNMSFSSWLPWTRSSPATSAGHSENVDAETKLKDLLRASSSNQVAVA